MKIRVLSLQSGAILGGSELMNFSIIRRMNRNQFDITICFLDEEGPVSEFYKNEGFLVYHLNYHKRSLFWVIWDLLRFLKIGKFDIVHIYGLRANLLGRVLGRMVGCRTIVTSQHSIDSWRNKWHVWLDRITSRWVSLYISNTYAAAERLSSVECIPRNKIRVIQNGLDSTPFESVSPGQVRSSLGIDSGKLVLVCVANMRVAKGHEVLLDAVHLLNREGLSFYLWLVGDGVLRKAIEAKVEELGLLQITWFLGQRTDIPEVLADSDIFVLASYWEGMPGAIMEAMASRLPVVATRVGGIPELVIDGETGFLVPPNNRKALAIALGRLMRDTRLRYQMGQAGYQRIIKYFRLEDKVREQEELYVQLFTSAKKIQVVR